MSSYRKFAFAISYLDEFLVVNGKYVFHAEVNEITAAVHLAKSYCVATHADMAVRFDTLLQRNISLGQKTDHF